MILGLFWMGIANAAVCLGAHALLERCRTGQGATDAVLFLLFRILLISAAVLAAGVAGLLAPLPLGLAGTASLALLLAAGAHRRLSRIPLREAGGLALSLLGLIGLRFLLQTWFFAPHVGDALAYHLPKVGEWIRAGGFTREMGLSPASAFPAGFELIETWWVVFLRHDVLIELAGVEFAALGFAALASIGRNLGLSWKSAALAGALYLLLPGFAFQVIGSVNDAPAAAMVLSAFALAGARVHPLALVIPAALGLGIKATTMYALPGWVLLCILHRRESSSRATFPSAAHMASVAAALTVGAFWYLRNLLWYSNPFHPVTAQGYAEGMIELQVGPSLESLGRNLAQLFGVLLYDSEGPQNALVFRISGWGALVSGCGLMALFIQLRVSQSFRRLALAFGISLACVMLMVAHDFWYPRFVLFFPGLMCLAVAELATSHRSVAILASGVALLQFVLTPLPGELPRARFAALLSQPWHERSVAEFHQGVPKVPAVAVYATVRTRLYFLYGPDFSRRVVYLRVRNADEMVEEMRAQGVGTVYVETPSARRTAEIHERVRDGRLRDLGRGWFALP